MVVFVRAFDKVGMIGVDCKLYFTDKLVFKANVHQNIVCTFFQSIFDSNDLQKFRPSFAVLRKLSEKPQNFPLLGTDLTSHEVSNLETDEVRRRWPASLSNELLIIDAFGDFEKTVNDTIEVEYNV